MMFPMLHLQIPEAIRPNCDVKPVHPFTGLASGFLTDLNRLNVFIGPNNSGKSRVLRELFAASPAPFVPHTAEVRQHMQVVEEFFRLLAPGQNDSPPETHRFRKLADTLSPILVGEHDIDRRINEQRKLLSQLSSAHSDLSRLSSWNEPIADSTFASLNAAARAFLGAAKAVCDTKPEPLKSPASVYIPTLRGFRPFPSTESDPYAFRTFGDYFAGRTTKVSDRDASSSIVGVPKIFTGYQMYDTVRDMLLGELESRETIADFQIYLSRFFENQQVTLIPRVGGPQVLHIKVGDEKEQPIHQLGDGLQHVIIQTFPLFLHRDKPLFLYIEEPELFLHPGLQRMLIDEFVREDAQNPVRQVFVATHSHQFLDLTLDRSSCSIFRVSKTLPGEGKQQASGIRVESVTDEGRGCLLDLGVRNSSVLLSNCSIWVEGTTDRAYLQKYLSIVQGDMPRQFLEDLHFSFVEYGGANVTHWSFLGESEPRIRADRICSHIFLIMDSDGADPTKKKGQRAQELREALGDRFHLLECREIENLLTPDAIRYVMQTYEKEDRFPEVKPFAQDAYARASLGSFIDTKVLADKSTSARFGKDERAYAAKSGTVKAKGEFCERALRAIKAKEDMSSEAIELAEKVYQFIASCNP